MKKWILTMGLLVLLSLLTACTGDAGSESVVYGSAPTISFDDLLGFQERESQTGTSSAVLSEVSSETTSGTKTSSESSETL